MSGTAKSLRAFLDASPSAALVEVAAAKGSTPREKGAWMLVCPEKIFGTIGGGQLEFMAIDRARKMLGSFSPLEGEMAAKQPEGVGQGNPGRNRTSSTASAYPTPIRSADRPSPQGGGKVLTLDIPLGPEIGQCCGGRVELSIKIIEEPTKADLIAKAEADDARLPHVYLFGGGHVGHALASAFALLPVRVMVVETRTEALDGIPESVESHLTAVPEELARGAPAGSAFVVLTHDHALDFLIVAEALRRHDAAYVGMIGSKTKKATFKSWYFNTAGGTEQSFARLVSPIGGDAVNDKRPAVIAALAAAEIMTALAKDTLDHGGSYRY